MNFDIYINILNSGPIGAYTVKYAQILFLQYLYCIFFLQKDKKYISPDISDIYLTRLLATLFRGFQVSMQICALYNPFFFVGYPLSLISPILHSQTPSCTNVQDLYLYIIITIPP